MVRLSSNFVPKRINCIFVNLVNMNLETTSLHKNSCEPRMPHVLKAFALFHSSFPVVESKLSPLVAGGNV